MFKETNDTDDEDDTSKIDTFIAELSPHHDPKEAEVFLMKYKGTKSQTYANSKYYHAQLVRNSNQTRETFQFLKNSFGEPSK